jgi:hypothetical protein
LIVVAIILIIAAIASRTCCVHVLRRTNHPQWRRFAH